jgi:uncharacterized protein (TIGR00255 family)
LRSVNHRFLSVSVKLPASLSGCEPELRERLRQRVARGHVTVIVRLESAAPTSGGVDEARFSAAHDALSSLSSRFSLPAPQLSDVLRMPGVLRSEEEMAADCGSVLAVVDRALEKLEEMRRAEGGRLGEYMRARLELMDAAVGRVEARTPYRLREYSDRLRASVASLMAGAQPDEQRLAQEIAMMADRLDVAEEIGRLRSHSTELRTTLADRSAEPVGKRLGFLLQEALREVNTIGSKGADAAILRDVVLMKEELERLREQSENIE